MTADRWLVAGLFGALLLDVGLLWFLSRRPRVRRGGYIADRWRRDG